MRTERAKVERQRRCPALGRGRPGAEEKLYFATPNGRQDGGVDAVCFAHVQPYWRRARLCLTTTFRENSLSVRFGGNTRIRRGERDESGFAPAAEPAATVCQRSEKDAGRLQAARLACSSVVGSPDAGLNAGSRRRLLSERRWACPRKGRDGSAIAGRHFPPRRAASPALEEQGCFPLNPAGK